MVLLQARETQAAHSAISLSTSLRTAETIRHLLLQSNSLLQAATLEAMQGRVSSRAVCAVVERVIDAHHSREGVQPTGTIYIPSVHGVRRIPANATVEFCEAMRLRLGPAQWLALGAQAAYDIWQVHGAAAGACVCAHPCLRSPELTGMRGCHAGAACNCPQRAELRS